MPRPTKRVIRRQSPGIGSLWLHMKSKKYYTVLGLCQLEATNRPAVLYAPIDGHNRRPWARDMAEFLDGRFQCVEPSLEDEDQAELDNWGTGNDR